LKKWLWSPGGHFFYPKKYPGCGLMMFRGPFYRYNVLSDGRLRPLKKHVQVTRKVLCMLLEYLPLIFEFFPLECN